MSHFKRMETKEVAKHFVNDRELRIDDTDFAQRVIFSATPVGLRPLQLTTTVVTDYIKDRFEDMEFGVDEEGNPDGLSNYMEMFYTIARDIADDAIEAYPREELEDNFDYETDEKYYDAWEEWAKGILEAEYVVGNGALLEIVANELLDESKEISINKIFGIKEREM